MARASILRNFRRRLARVISPEQTRGYDAASWKRFAPEARSHRTATETMQAAPQVRARARYFAGNNPHAAAGIAAIANSAVGTGPIPTHPNAELAARFINEFWNSCDADGRTDFGGLVHNAVRAMAIDGEAFIVLRQRADGLKLQLLPAEQIAEDEARELGGGFIAAGVEFNAQGERVAYWVRPFVPMQAFESWAPPVRVDAADVLHLMRPVGSGQVRGISWLAPVLLKIADLDLATDGILKGIQTAAMFAGFLEDANGVSQLPFDGEKSGDTLSVSIEPGGMHRLPAGYKATFSQPQQAQGSIEFITTQIEAISAGLGVPAHLISHNVSRANFSSLRASWAAFKSALETLQYCTLAPQVLNPIWQRWVLTESLRNDGEADAQLPEWRFPQLPPPDPLKDAQAAKALLDAKLASRAELIAARGESVERVNADIAADPHAQAPGDDPENEEDKTDAE
jgi:lambda family phage portal protein